MTRVDKNRFNNSNEIINKGKKNEINKQSNRVKVKEKMRLKESLSLIRVNKELI